MNTTTLRPQIQRASSFDRLKLRTQFQQLDLPLDHITRLHLRHIQAAGIASPREGLAVDAWMCELTHMQATALIRWLQKEIDD